LSTSTDDFTPAVRAWLEGVQPAWTLLDPESLQALYSQPAPKGSPIRLAADFVIEEIGQSAIARNALLLLSAASVNNGLKLTATGNLSRKIVSEMFEAFIWPDLDKNDLLRYHKVLNEPDFMPLWLVRNLVQTAGLVEEANGFLRTTANGRTMLDGLARRALQAILFHVTFWLLDLNFLGRGLPDSWPQRDIGIVLWSLLVAADRWQTPWFFTRACTIPSDEIIARPHDIALFALEARVLRPLYFFGLLEHRVEADPKRPISQKHFYRKSPLFDRFLSFDVKLQIPGGLSH
jgi:hypothetical protein